MNIEEFDILFDDLQSQDKIKVDDLCTHENHQKDDTKVIGKQPARRNILKNGGKCFICRNCYMKHNNPMNQTGPNRQTDEVIAVLCPSCGDLRNMKMSCYYGSLDNYEQICGSCAQKGKTVSEECRKKISNTLKDVPKSEEFKENLREYMKNNPEGIARGKANLIPGSGGGWNKGQETPIEVREKISQANMGKTRTEEQCQHISEGRKKMLEAQGGFSVETKRKLSEAAIRQYQNGFDPSLFHLRGKHQSMKNQQYYTYRSSYEKKAFMLLDMDDAVDHYDYEPIDIPYVKPNDDHQSSYLLDLVVYYKDGSRKFVEVKPKTWLTNGIVMAKIAAGRKLAEGIGHPFEVWTEKELFGDSKKLQEFVDWLRDLGKQDGELPSSEARKELGRQKAKKHYDAKIATDKVEVYCDFCEETHTPLRLTYDRNIARNGTYVCERLGGHIAGSKPKTARIKINPYADEGKKQCSKCEQVLLFECFSPDSSKRDGYCGQCKECRSSSAKKKYQESKS